MTYLKAIQQCLFSIIFEVLPTYSFICLLLSVSLLKCQYQSLAWDGVIFIHSGIYEGACFKFSMRIPPHYPDCTAPVCCRKCHISLDAPSWHHFPAANYIFVVKNIQMTCHRLTVQKQNKGSNVKYNLSNVDLKYF